MSDTAHPESLTDKEVAALPYSCGCVTRLRSWSPPMPSADPESIMLAVYKEQKRNECTLTAALVEVYVTVVSCGHTNILEWWAAVQGAVNHVRTLLSERGSE